MCMYVSLLVVVFDAARARAPTRAEPGREAPHTRGGGSAMRSVAADSSCRLPSLGKRPAEILREIGLDLDAPAVHRVGEGEPAGTVAAGRSAGGRRSDDRRPADARSPACARAPDGCARSPGAPQAGPSRPAARSR